MQAAATIRYPTGAVACGRGAPVPIARLLGADRWAMLPVAVRRRFASPLPADGCVTYAGRITECRMRMGGRLLAQLARMIGSPLPRCTDTGVAASVSVTADQAGGGQFWTRQYNRRRGFPQVIHSIKRFAGPTGLEEYLGAGIGIALRLDVRDGALLFLGDHYFCSIGPWRFRVPGWAEPGRLTVTHRDLGAGRFAFTLNLEHPWFGLLIHQRAEFVDGGAHRFGDAA